METTTFQAAGLTLTEREAALSAAGDPATAESFREVVADWLARRLAQLRHQAAVTTPVHGRLNPTVISQLFGSVEEFRVKVVRALEGLREEKKLRVDQLDEVATLDREFEAAYSKAQPTYAKVLKDPANLNSRVLSRVLVALNCAFDDLIIDKILGRELSAEDMFKVIQGRSRYDEIVAEVWGNNIQIRNAFTLAILTKVIAELDSAYHDSGGPALELRNPTRAFHAVAIAPR